MFEVAKGMDAGVILLLLVLPSDNDSTYLLFVKRLFPIKFAVVVVVVVVATLSMYV